MKKQPSEETVERIRHIGQVVTEDRPYSFRKGERFVIEAPSSDSTVYWIYEVDTLRFRGMMPMAMFKQLEEFTEPPAMEEEVDVEVEQLSLFD